MRILFFAPLLAFVGSSFVASPVRAVNLPLAKKDLDAQWELLSNGKGHGQYGAGQGVRGVFRFVLEGAAVGYNQERLDEALRIADHVQDRDPASPTYGNLKWDITASAVLDRNAVEFCMQQAVIIDRLYRANLDSSGQEILERIMRLSIEGMARHKVPVTYTNMALMKSENEIMVGELMKNEACAARGYEDLDNWVNYTKRWGINEYISPNYYGPDIDALGLVAKFASRAKGRGEAAAALRYLWTDVAANWFRPGERLGGAHSRNYDYLYGRGEFDMPLGYAGWLSYKPESESPGWLAGPRSHLTAFNDTCIWIPPASLSDPIKSEIPRIVVQRWGEAEPDLAVNYVGRSFALASTGAFHGDDDHELTVYWPGGRHMVQSDFFIDGRGDPYGNRPRMGKDGHSKALHLAPFIVTAQKGAEVLECFSDEPYGPGSKNHPGDLTELNAQWVLPAAAVVSQQSGSISAGSVTHSSSVDLREPFFVRLQNVIVGVRILLAADVHGVVVRSANYVQENPASDRKHIAIVLSPTEPFGRGTVVVWMRAAEDLTAGQTEAFMADFALAPAAAQFSGSVLRAHAQGLSSELEISADPTKAKSALSKGGEPIPVLLSVNGREVGKPVWTAGLREP